MPYSVQPSFMGRRTGLIRKLVCMYEGALCRRLLGQQIIFTASADKKTLQGFLSVLQVVSAEIKSEPETLLWSENPKFPSW